jgi:hypothetical protein
VTFYEDKMADIAGYTFLSSKSQGGKQLSSENIIIKRNPRVCFCIAPGENKPRHSFADFLPPPLLPPSEESRWIIVFLSFWSTSENILPWGRGGGDAVGEGTLRTNAVKIFLLEQFRAIET